MIQLQINNLFVQVSGYRLRVTDNDAKENTMKTYTVFGLIDQDACELIVAAVIEGQHDCIDSGGDGEYQRWSDSFEADGPNQAEQLAQDQVRASLQEEDEEPRLYFGEEFTESVMREDTL